MAKVQEIITLLLTVQGVQENKTSYVEI